MKANKRNLFKYIKSRKTARETVGQLHNEIIKGKLKKDVKVAKKLNKFFASFFLRKTKGRF